MAPKVQVAEGLCLQTTVLLFLSAFPCVRTTSPVILDATVHTPVYVSQYQSYPDVSVFKFNIPPMATDAHWVMVANRTVASCPVIEIVMTLQSGGYPVINPLNETFPEDFYLNRTNLQHVRLKSNGTPVAYHLTAPYPGTWYGVAYAVEHNNRVIKKMTDVNCKFTLAVNLTTKGWDDIPEILTGDIGQRQRFVLSADHSLSYLRFHINSRTWAFEVNINKCAINNKALERCPLQVSVRSGGLPSEWGTDTLHKNCSQSAVGKPCHINFVGPITNTFQYLKLIKGGNQNLSFSISLKVKECGNPHSTFSTSGVSSAGEVRLKRRAQPDDVIVVSPTHTNFRDICMSCMHLFRTTEVANDFVTTYALRPSRLEFVENQVRVSSLFARIFSFEIRPQQDGGGTLRFSLQFNITNKTSAVHTNVTACLQRGEIPTRGSLLRCRPENVVRVHSGIPGRVRRVPFPEEGLWYLALQMECYTLNATTGETTIVACKQTNAAVMFDLRVTACLDQGCGQYGTCHEYFSSSYAFSYCNCRGGVSGYACDDWSRAPAKSTQMLYTLLLTMSNLFFIPAIILALVRRRFSEAIVYFANMFFSAFYHACDMGPWSVYRICIMPYSVLQHLDFFCSIMSFWVTLVAVAELEGSLYSVSHMLGAILLAMAVDWKMHGLIPYLVPISIGVIIIVVSFGVKSYRRKHLYPGKKRLLLMLPGLALALTGIGIFCFVETDKNYPITHSAWHLCMSLCILFFLPRKQPMMPSSPGSSSISTSSEDSILRFHQETSDMVNLMSPADGLGVDSDDDKDDELLHDF